MHLEDHSKAARLDAGLRPWQRKLHTIIFEAETPAGKFFDVALLLAIIVSVIAVILESVQSINDRFHLALRIAEWVFTVMFTVEYVLRLLCVKRPLRYAFSFFGIVDLLSIVPTYVSVFVPGSQELLVIRGLRLLRVFRVLKLGRYLGEAEALRDALRASTAKITVFLMTVITVVIIMGSTMHLVEGPESGFRDIPHGIYWAIVTITTVGFGDITPETVLGKIIASMIMVFGYSLIIVPTGIISAEMTASRDSHAATETCPHCMKAGHRKGANFCDRCGGGL